MDVFFIVASTVAFVSGIVWMLVSVGALAALVGRLLPLLNETRDNIQELGDLSANTVSRAADTMEIVEARVSQAMGGAAQAGAKVTKKAVGAGTALAGLYVALRVIAAFRSPAARPGKRRRKRRR